MEMDLGLAIASPEEEYLQAILPQSQDQEGSVATLEGSSDTNIDTPSSRDSIDNFDYFMTPSYSSRSQDVYNGINEQSKDPPPSLSSSYGVEGLRHDWATAMGVLVENGVTYRLDEGNNWEEVLPSHSTSFEPDSEELPSAMDYSTSLDNFSSVFEEPWSPVEPYNLPQYVPGYVAFAPSPPSGLDTPGDTIINLPDVVSPKTPIPSGIPAKRFSKPKARRKGKEPIKESKWTFVSEQLDPDKKSTEERPRLGIRTGQLAPAIAAKARRIRRLKACWKCRVQKVPCSEGEPCETCTKQFSGLARQMCCRSALNEYVPAFFPDLLYSHFTKKEVEDFITDNSYGFLDKSIDIEVSTGDGFAPIKVQAHIFQPKTWEIMGQFQHTIEGSSLTPLLVEQYSAPVGIMSLPRDDFKAQCKVYIQGMMRHPKYIAHTTVNDCTVLPTAILIIAQEYHDATKSSLIHNVLMLHAIHHFMSTLLTLTTESAMKIYDNIIPIGPAPGLFLSSRFLNRQLKYVMTLLQREVCQEVLESLEKNLKLRSKDAWGVSFCTLLVLCLCIEKLQIAADSFVVSDIPKDGKPSTYNRGQSFEACIALEDYPFQQCTRLFHDIYRSGRDGVGGGPGWKNGFNPLRVLSEGGKDLNLDKPSELMVTSVYNLISNSYEDITQLAGRSSMLEEPNVGYNEIKAHNTGRVTAKYLLSFFEETAA